MEAGVEDPEPLVQCVHHAELAVSLHVRPDRRALGDPEGEVTALVAAVRVGGDPGAGPEVPDHPISASSVGLPLSARRQNSSPASLAPQATQTLRLESSWRGRRRCACAAHLGIPVAPLVPLPSRDSSRYVPSTCHDIEGPVLNRRSDRAMTSQNLMCMNQEVRRHTRQSPAHSPRLPPARVDSTKAPQVAASSFEAASSPLLLAENVLLQPLQSHRWEPSALWPFLMRGGVKPRRGQHVGRASALVAASSRVTAAFVVRMSPHFSQRESPLHLLEYHCGIPSPSPGC